MRIHPFGVRGSIPTPGPGHVRYGGNTSCVGIETTDGMMPILLDAGTGMRNVGSVVGDQPYRGSILLGHLHWDHTYGLPFFAPGDRESARVDVYLPDQGDPVALLERAMSPPAFPISPTGLRGEWTFTGLTEGSHTIEGMEVLALEIPHKGGRTFGYRIDDGDRAVAYLSDHAPTNLGPGSDGLGERHDKALSLASGVDLLIHDSQYTAEEMVDRADWGHCSWEYPMALAESAGARQVLLHHHDPGHDDEFLDKIAARLPAHVSLAVEGEPIEL